MMFIVAVIHSTTGESRCDVGKSSLSGTDRLEVSAKFNHRQAADADCRSASHKVAQRVLKSAKRYHDRHSMLSVRIAIGPDKSPSHADSHALYQHSLPHLPFIKD
jgi:hypothetical protein